MPLKFPPWEISIKLGLKNGQNTIIYDINGSKYSPGVYTARISTKQ